jgi:hypothetical protein
MDVNQPPRTWTGPAPHPARLYGKRMTIVEAMEAAGTKENYQTVYRRIQRGWKVKEALGLTERA